MTTISRPVLGFILLWAATGVWAVGANVGPPPSGVDLPFLLFGILKLIGYLMLGFTFAACAIFQFWKAIFG